MNNKYFEEQSPAQPRIARSARSAGKMSESWEAFGREIRHETLRPILSVLDQYFDLELESTDIDALPEPEDVWRFHRDIKEVLLPYLKGEK